MSFFFELLLTAFFSLLISSLLAKLFSSSSSSTSSSHGAADVISRGTRLSGKGKREREGVQEEEEKIIEVDETGDGFSCSEDNKEVLDDSEVEFEKEKVDDGETFLEKELCVIEFGDGKILQNQLMEEHRLVADSYNLIFGEDQSGLIKQEEHVLGEIEVQVNDPVKVKVEKDNICEVEGPTSKMVFETVDTQKILLLQEESLENPKASEEFEKARDLRDNLSDPVTEMDEKDNICEVEGPTSKIFLENADTQNSSSWHDNLSELEGPANKIPQLEENITEALVLKEEDQEQNLPKTEGPECKIPQQEENITEALVLKEEDQEQNLPKTEGPECKIPQQEESSVISKTSNEDNLGELERPASKIPQQEESLIISKTSNEGNLGELEGPASKIPQQDENITEEQDKNLSKTEGLTCKTTPLEEKETAFDEEEEWEGIERSETEERFSVATNYATSDVVSKLSDDVHLKLYGLHKVATEGPCYESSPMAIRASTRAKWHAWQRLGNMNPEMAMEQYMSLLSQNVPDWDGQPPNIENIEENERERSYEELKTYHAYDQVTNESEEGLNLTASVSESPNKAN